MSRATRSVAMDSPEKLALKSLLTIFSRIGHEPGVDVNAATVIQMLRDHPAWMLTTEGKQLFAVCRRLLRGSRFEPALFPEVQSPAYRKAKQDCEERADAFIAKFENTPDVSYEALLGQIMADRAERKKQQGGDHEATEGSHHAGQRDGADG